MDYLIKYARDRVDLTDDEIVDILSIFTKKSYTKGQLILNMGDSSSKSYYVSSGSMRTYSIDTTGQEQTWALHVNNDKYTEDPFAGNFSSYFFKRQKSDIFIEAYSDAIVYEAEYNKLDEMYEKSLSFMKLGLRMYQEQAAIVAERTKMFKNLNTKEKYLLLQKVSPMYEEILTNYQLANILNVAPQSLSRIKKKIENIT